MPALTRFTNLSAVLAGCILTAIPAFAEYTVPLPPYSLAAGNPGSTAIRFDDPRIEGWASGFLDYLPGPEVAASWQNPSEALGPASETAHGVVVLGRGGQITLTLTPPVVNGDGFDMAVFENSFSDTFLELAHVEVSSNGVDFVRFPGYSATAGTVGGFGVVQPHFITGFAGKYRAGYGTPFDLQELRDAFALVRDRGPDYVWEGPEELEFSQAYADHLRSQVPKVDLDRITHVRLIDIVGDGAALDALGNPVWDPFPSHITAGFDLDAVAILNAIDPVGGRQSITFAPIPHQRLADGTLSLAASATSGLPVTFRVVEGPASVSGDKLTFTGRGQVVVEAGQPGDDSWEPAVPVTRSFVVADDVQSLSTRLLPNILAGSGPVHLEVRSSSGLPVSLEVVQGPANIVIDPQTQRMEFGLATGEAVIRAFQDGGQRDGTTFAPATDFYFPVSIVAADSVHAPKPYAAVHSGNPGEDTDKDGFANKIEFVLGSDPFNPDRKPDFQITHGADANGRPAIRLRFSYDPATSPAPSVLTGQQPGIPDPRTLPQVVAWERLGTDPSRHQVTIALPTKLPASFLWISAD